MPFYNRLRPYRSESDKRKSDKKRIANKLLELRSALRQHIYGDQEVQVEGDEAFLRLATWNIREFDSGKFGARLPESLYYIAEILSAFDLIAVQEVRDDRKALDAVMKILGPGWHYIATDVTEGSGGNRERMAFIYNNNKVWFNDIAGEIVLDKGDRITYPQEERLRFSQGLSLELPENERLVSPPAESVKTYRRDGKERLKEEVEIDLPAGASLKLPPGARLVLPHRHVVDLAADGRIELPQGQQIAMGKEVMVKLPMNSIVGDSLQFARTPFSVSFQAGWLKLNLCTVHIYYGEGKAGLRRRNAEIRKLTEFLAERAQRDNDSDADSFFIVLGDFNIIGRGHATMRSLESNGFKVPEALKSVPGSNVKKDKAYDQIAYWAEEEGEERSPDAFTRIEVKKANVFDYFETVFRLGDSDPDGEDKAFYDDFVDLPGKGWEYADWRTHQMSDHLPMWVELRVDFGDEYLQRIAKEW